MHFLFRIAKYGSPAANTLCARHFASAGGVIAKDRMKPFSLSNQLSNSSDYSARAPALLLYRTARSTAQRGSRRFSDDNESTRYDDWGSSSNSSNNSNNGENKYNYNDDGGGGGGGGGGGNSSSSSTRLCMMIAQSESIGCHTSCKAAYSLFQATIRSLVLQL